MTKYPNITDIEKFHQDAIQQYGGVLGVLNRDALESAWMRPQNGHYDDIIAKAAALMESLAGNHPFVDGNKRTAVATVDVFLRLNGYRIRVESIDLYNDIIGMFEKKEFTFDNIEAMLRRVVKKETGEDS